MDDSHNLNDELNVDRAEQENNDLLKVDNFLGFQVEDEEIGDHEFQDVQVNLTSIPAQQSDKFLEALPAPRKKRGRPRKNKNGDSQINADSKPEVLATSAVDMNDNIAFGLPKKKRGRPKKNSDVVAAKGITPTSLLSVLEIKSPRSCKRSAPWEDDYINEDALPAESSMFPKKKRGRPKKIEYNQGQSISDASKRVQKIPTKYSDSSMMFKRKYRKLKAIGRPKIHASASRPLPPVIGRKRGRPRKDTREKKTEVQVNGLKEDLLDAFEKKVPAKHEDEKVIDLSETYERIHGLGWSPGNTGGISVLHQDKIYIACNQSQSEASSEFSCYNASAETVKDDDTILMKIHQNTNAGAVVHSRSDDAVLASLLSKGNEFRITHQEMICEIQNSSCEQCHKYDDILVVPILQNTLNNEELSKRVTSVTSLYPDINAMLVRRRGLYVWSNNLQNAVSQAECYHNLFRIAMKMRQIGIEPDQYPKDEYGLAC